MGEELEDDGVHVYVVEHPFGHLDPTNVMTVTKKQTLRTL